MALCDGAAAFLEELNQPPATAEVHPVLVEERSVDKVMLVGH